MRLPRTFASRIAAAAVILASSVTAVSFVRAQAQTSENRKPIRTCADVGLCKKGKRTMLLDNDRTFSGWARQYALARGCTLTKQREKKSRILCPEALAIPYAIPERVFELHDIPSNEHIGAIIAHERGYNGQGVTVALIDSGVDTLHPELAGVVQATANFTTESADDTLGHGTHVAGIVAGQNINDFNGYRVLGTAPGVQLIVAKVCNNQGFCLEGDINAGVEWAVSQGADVINMSLGAGSFMGNCDSDPLAEQANWAVDQGIVVVAAAGNHGTNSEGVAAPGCASKVLAVGAVNVNDERPSWSGYGKALDIVAPGVGVFSSFPCAPLNICPSVGAVPGNGTSMAAPHVAGAAAALLQINPMLSPADVSEMLIGTAVDLGTAGFDRFYGYGRLDMNAAIDRLLERDTPPPPESSASSEESSSSSSEAWQSSSSDEFWHEEEDVDEPHDDDESDDHSDDDDDDSDEHSSSSRQRPQEPRPCVPADWRCGGFEDCSERGVQERECELKNERCINPDRARPALTRRCERRRDDDDRDNRGPGNAEERGRSWQDWIRGR